MKAAVIHHFGEPEVLKLEDVPTRMPGASEVLIAVAAAGVNPIDTRERRGELQARLPLTFPAILGWDLAGTVQSVGPEVQAFRVGDRVLGWADRTYAERCVVEAALLALVPRELELADAAALPLVSAAGVGAVVAAGIEAGQRVLIAGANGAVGRCATFAAGLRGAHTIAGVAKRRIKDLQSVGAETRVALDDPDAWDALKPVDVVVNCVRGATAEQLLGKLKPGGVFSSLTGDPANAATRPDARFTAFSARPEPKHYALVAEGVADGKITIPIAQRFPLAQAAAAHATLEKGGSGKLLLLP